MKTDRREFLKGAAWMGAAAAVVGCSTTKGFGFGDGGSMATYADKPFKKLRVGIVGLGNIGTRVAAVAEAFGMQVLYYPTSGGPWSP